MAPTHLNGYMFGGIVASSYALHQDDLVHAKQIACPTNAEVPSGAMSVSNESGTPRPLTPELSGVFLRDTIDFTDLSGEYNAVADTAPRWLRHRRDRRRPKSH